MTHPHHPAKRRAPRPRPRVKQPLLIRLGIRLTAAQREIARRTTLLVTLGLLLIAVAAWAPARFDVSDGPHPIELQGAYLAQIAQTETGRPVVFVLHLEPHGQLRTEFVGDTSHARRFATGVVQYANRRAWWRIERASGIAALWQPPRLCLRGPSDAGTCVRLDWDADTGNLTLGGPLALGGGDHELLARLRSNLGA
jgi:hypothetical protein